MAEEEEEEKEEGEEEKKEETGRRRERGMMIKVEGCGHVLVMVTPLSESNRTCRACFYAAFKFIPLIYIDGLLFLSLYIILYYIILYYNGGGGGWWWEIVIFLFSIL